MPFSSAEAKAIIQKITRVSQEYSEAKFLPVLEEIFSALKEITRAEALAFSGDLNRVYISFQKRFPDSLQTSKAAEYIEKIQLLLNIYIAEDVNKPNKNNELLLESALKIGDVDIVGKLVEIYKANPDKMDFLLKNLYLKTKTGESTMGSVGGTHVSFELGKNFTIFGYEIYDGKDSVKSPDCKANIHLINDQTPADKKGSEGGAKVFIEVNEVDKNTQDKYGNTALMVLLHITHDLECLPMVKLLLEHGAKTTIKNKEGITPLDYARKHQMLNTVKLLEQYTFEKESPKEKMPGIESGDSPDQREQETQESGLIQSGFFGKRKAGEISEASNSDKRDVRAKNEAGKKECDGPN